jgi:hypothetical protein
MIFLILQHAIEFVAAELLRRPRAISFGNWIPCKFEPNMQIYKVCDTSLGS